MSADGAELFGASLLVALKFWRREQSLQALMRKYLEHCCPGGFEFFGETLLGAALFFLCSFGRGMTLEHPLCSFATLARYHLVKLPTRLDGGDYLVSSQPLRCSFGEDIFALASDHFEKPFTSMDKERGTYPSYELTREAWERFTLEGPSTREHLRRLLPYRSLIAASIFPVLQRVHSGIPSLQLGRTASGAAYTTIGEVPEDLHLDLIRMTLD